MKSFEVIAWMAEEEREQYKPRNNLWRPELFVQF
jgi:hypothetical protein